MHPAVFPWQILNELPEFSATPGSLRWRSNRSSFNSRWVLASIMGAIFGPASYVAGERLGGVALVDAQAALITLGAGWALIMPGLMALADRLDGMTAPSAARVRIR